MSTPANRVLPGGADVAFGEIARALARRPEPRGPARGTRALPATVVVFGPDDRLTEAAGALKVLAGHSTLRGILVSPGTDRRPVPCLDGDLVALSGLEPTFVNNAVAALRLSSLPTLVWWRAAGAELLADLVRLADRVVLDAEAPLIWQRAVRLFDDAAFTDLRWTRMTRWRSLMAHFFDMADVRLAASAFTTLKMAGSDPEAAALFCAWLGVALGRPGGLALQFEHATSGAFIQSVWFGEGEQGVELRLAPSGGCVLTAARVEGRHDKVRAVSLGDQSLAALVAEELRIRSRDRAFETAVQALLERT